MIERFAVVPSALDRWLVDALSPDDGRRPLTETRVNPAGLTSRQVDVLRLLSMGRTNPEIASELVIPVRTVDSQVAAVLGKLGAASRREAAARAAELGLLDTGYR